MWTYDCDYEIQSYRLTPTFKRLEKRLAYQNCVDGQIQYNHDKFFDSFIGGDASAAYSNVTAYVDGDRVNYQNKIYECILATTGNLPTDTTYWIPYVSDFRGVVERIKYNCQTVMLEWILNRWFATSFVQPGGGNSDIYIVNNDRSSSTFVAGAISGGVTYGSYVYSTPEFVDDFVPETPSFSSSPNFTVYYPISLIPTITNEKYYQLVNLVNKYKTFGSTVEYISY